MKFSVTYEVVTPESAELGDAEERGFVIENASLRDALRAVKETRTSLVDGVECVEPSSMPGNDFRWITVVNGMEYETGAQESRSLHIPECVTNATRGRILRLVK